MMQRRFTSRHNLGQIVGALIRKKRLELGLTQEVMWTALDANRKTYSQIELGRIQINLSHLALICPLLQLNIGNLIVEAEDILNTQGSLPVTPYRPLPAIKVVEEPVRLELPSWLGGTLPPHLKEQHDASVNQLRRRNYQRDLEDSAELCEADQG